MKCQQSNHSSLSKCTGAVKVVDVARLELSKAGKKSKTSREEAPAAPAVTGSAVFQQLLQAQSEQIKGWG